MELRSPGASIKQAYHTISSTSSPSQWTPPQGHLRWLTFLSAFASSVLTCIHCTSAHQQENIITFTVHIFNNVSPRLQLNISINQFVSQNKAYDWHAQPFFSPYDMRKILMYEIVFGISIQLSQSEALWNTSYFCNPDGLSGLFMKLLHSVNSRKSEIFNNIYRIIELHSQNYFVSSF